MAESGEEDPEAIYLWVYGRPWAEVVFDFTSTRSRDGPSRFLKGYSGVLQTDAYAGYNEILRTGGITHHVHRYRVGPATRNHWLGKRERAPLTLESYLAGKDDQDDGTEEEESPAPPLEEKKKRSCWKLPGGWKPDPVKERARVRKIVRENPRRGEERVRLRKLRAARRSASLNGATAPSAE